MATTAESTPKGRPRSEQQAAAISNMMVRTCEHTGRESTTARTTVTEDVVSCVMHDTLTTGEMSLVNRGEASDVLVTRRLHKQLMRADVSAEVEQITGRTVLAFLSHDHVDPELTVETWVLAPGSRSTVASPS